MDEAQYLVLSIQNAATRRKESEAKWQEATDDLRRDAIAARKLNIGVTEIARVAGLSRQGVYDLISERPSQ